MPKPAFDSIFVLCTGRCGSTTLARACGHASNWTAGHETRSHLLGEARLDYPTRHVEVDNRLSWMLGRLETRYGPNAGYVHLTRDPEAVAQSYAARAAYGIMHAYAQGIVFPSPAAEGPRPMLDYARDMVATVTANIDAFLVGKPHVMRLTTEALTRDLPALWDWAGMSGRLDLALQECSIRHNESVPAGTPGRIGRVGTWQENIRRALRWSPGRRAG